jgi:hypothetical protein
VVSRWRAAFQSWLNLVCGPFPWVASQGGGAEAVSVAGSVFAFLTDVGCHVLGVVTSALDNKAHVREHEKEREGSTVSAQVARCHLSVAVAAGCRALNLAWCTLLFPVLSWLSHVFLAPLWKGSPGDDSIATFRGSRQTRDRVVMSTGPGCRTCACVSHAGLKAP